jgi:tetratricopeptide (TPR) repeat protein
MLAYVLLVALLTQEEVPEVARTLMEDAARAASAHRVDDAIAKYEKVLELAPAVTAAYTNLGTLYFEKGNAAKALEVFQHGLAGAPADRTLLTNAATAAQQLGRSDEALALVDRAIERVPRDAALLSLRSTILRSLNRSADALAAIDQALAVAPREARYHFARGNLLFQLHRNDDAIGAYQQAIGIDRAYLRAWYNLGAVLFESGRYGEALQAYKVALEPIEKSFAKKETVDAAHAPAYANLGAIYLKQQQWPAAIDAYQKALRLDPKSASAHYSLGFIYYSTQQWASAVPEYEAALALDSALPLAYLHLAEVALRQGDAAKAVETLQRGTPHFDATTKLPALKTLGRAELARGNRPKARAAYEEALRNDPRDVETLLALARIHRADQRMDEAAKVLGDAERIAPANPAVLLERVLLARVVQDDAAERRALDELLARDRRPELWPLRAERFLLALRQEAVPDAPRELAGLIAGAPPANAASLRALRALLLAHAGSFDEARRDAGAGTLLAAAIDALTARRDEAVRNLTLQSNSAVAKGNLGIVLWQQNRLADARAPLLEAARAFPDWYEVRLALGESYLASRDWDEAAEALVKCEVPPAKLVFTRDSVAATLGRNDTLCARARQGLSGAQAVTLFLRGTSELTAGSAQKARESFTRALSFGLPPAAEAAARANLAAIEESQKSESEPEEEPASSQVRRTVVIFLPDLPAENEKRLAEAVTASMNQTSSASGVPLNVELFRRAEDARAFVSGHRDSVGLVVSNPEFVSALGADLRARFQFLRDGQSTYRRVVVVPVSSSARSIADLRARSTSVADGLREPGSTNVVRSADDLSALANVLYGKTDAAFVSEDNPLLAQHAGELRVIYTSAPFPLPVVAFAPMIETDREALDRSFRTVAGHALARIERERPRAEPKRIEVATVPPASLTPRLPDPPAIVPLRVVVELPVIAIPEGLYSRDFDK